MLKNTLALSEYDVFYDFASNFPIEGKSVLEIGGCLNYDYVKEFDPSIWVAIDPRNEDRQINKKCKYIKGYAQLIPYGDNSFDYIFSCNAFHHIAAFESALYEMYRVLKPGGGIYANFGPIWSAPDGSHLENVIYQGKVINFWETPYIPDWYHLIYTFRELYDILSTRLEPGLAKTLVEYVYLNNWINRLEYGEYKRALEKSPFQIEFFDGVTEYGYENVIPEYDNQYREKVNVWKEKKADQLQNYQIRDIKLWIRK